MGPHRKAGQIHELLQLINLYFDTKNAEKYFADHQSVTFHLKEDPEVVSEKFANLCFKGLFEYEGSERSIKKYDEEHDIRTNISYNQTSRTLNITIVF